MHSLSKTYTYTQGQTNHSQKMESVQTSSLKNHMEIGECLQIVVNNPLIIVLCKFISLFNSKSMTTQPYNDHKQSVWHPNRAYHNLPNSIIIDSCFPGGNVATATLITTNPLTIEVEGNTDINLDTSSKYWLYFRIRGYRKQKPIKFILKNANHLRKYYGQTRYKPYMVYKQDDDSWQPNSTPIQLSVQENGYFQGSFVFQSQKYSKTNKVNKSTNQLYPGREQKTMASTSNEESKRGNCYFAIYYPYSYEDLNTFIDRSRTKLANNSANEKAYFNHETIAYSYERRKIPLITITSYSNIESFSQKQPIISEEIFPNPKQRPFKMKNNPVLIFSARVHPSQTSSSFFIQGLIDFLLNDSKASSILRELFIIHVLPMLNPDGVQHGNFRFDHELRNLNRYYGQSSIEKTPSIRAAELLIDYYKNRNNQQCQYTEFYQETYNRLFMYVDVHGHSSALPSFIYGNHTDKIQHLIENKVFCKLMELNSVPGGFSKLQSEFSKKNMTLQQKYDQHSKLCSGRVFAGRADLPQYSVFHSYTFEVLPYWQEFQRRKNGQKSQKLSSPDYARQLGKSFLLSLLDLLDVNPQSKLSEMQIERARKNITKECHNQQMRRNFLGRKAETAVEKQGFRIKQTAMSERETVNHNQYIQRWFSNHILLKNLFSKIELFREPKVLKFYQKILKIIPYQADNELLQAISPRKQTVKEKPQKDSKNESPLKGFQKRQDSLINNDKIKTILHRQERKMANSEDKHIFVCRNKEKNKIEPKISKQTIELKQQFMELIPRHKTIQKDPQFKFGRREFSIKKEPYTKQPFDSTQRYEREVLNKIHTESKQYNVVNPLMEVKKKEIKIKPKSNTRIQTEAVGEPFVSSTADIEINQKINPCSSQVGHFYRKQVHTLQNESNSNKANAYFRPSFIEEFILKIREERESVQNHNANKYNNREELKQKAMKLRPSIKEYVEQQQKKILPMLRRNKIFTIVSQNSQIETHIHKQYDSHFNSKKRAVTVQSEDNYNADQHPRRAKKNVPNYKKEQPIKQQAPKKTNHFGQLKFI